MLGSLASGHECIIELERTRVYSTMPPFDITVENSLLAAVHSEEVLFSWLLAAMVKLITGTSC